MRTSQNGINLIKSFEGCRLAAYKCAAGVPTIGYGHTAGVKMGQTITQMQAESYLKDDLMKYETKVMKYYDKYRFNQNEFDALVSFAYNIGSIDQLTAGGTRSRKVILLQSGRKSEYRIVKTQTERACPVPHTGKLHRCNTGGRKKGQPYRAESRTGTRTVKLQTV